MQVRRSIDIEYNKRPCFEDKLTEGSNLQYKVTNQFDAGDKLYILEVHYVVLAITSSLKATLVLIHKMLKFKNFHLIFRMNISKL